MKDELFDELIESVRQGGAILRGEAKPSRSFEIGAPDVKRIRENFRLSQPEFATMLGIGVATLRNWEQGRRTPDGPARVLLRVAEQNPRAVWDAVRFKTPARKPRFSKAARAAAKSSRPALPKK